MSHIVHEIPYLDTRDLNLDWLLKNQRELWDAIGNLKTGASGVTIVDNYGTHGDGVTDDSAIINNVIREHPNTIIAFTAQQYRIDNTIELWGNQGGCLYLFGGSNFIWGGVKDANKSMVISDHTTDYESRCIIVGGTFNCNDSAGIGVWLNTYHAAAVDCKVYDCTAYAYKIGSYGVNRSLQCVIKNCFASITHGSNQGWSDKNNCFGLGIYEPDNFIDTLDTLRFKGGIYKITAGDLITNCHITAQVTNVADDLPVCYGVYLDPISATAINNDSFDNMYFDNVKFCFYMQKDNRRSITMSNSRYFNSGHQSTGVTNAFMIGGGHPASFYNDGFCVVPAGSPANCRFFDASFAPNINWYSRTKIKETYQHTIFSLSAAYNLPWLASHYVNSNDTMDFIRGSDLTPGTHFLAGCLVLHNVNPDAIATTTIDIQNRMYGTLSIKLRGQRNNKVIVDSYKIYPSFPEGFKIVIDQPISETINTQTCYIIKIWVVSTVAALTDTYMTIKCDYTTPLSFYVPCDTLITGTPSDDNITINLDTTINVIENTVIENELLSRGGVNDIKSFSIPSNASTTINISHSTSCLIYIKRATIAVLALVDYWTAGANKIINQDANNRITIDHDALSYNITIANTSSLLVEGLVIGNASNIQQ